MFDAAGGPKYLSAGKLKQLLAELPDTDLIFPNTVMNLRIERDRSSIGYIDFAREGEVVLWKLE